jgi:general secretion pathway protein D
MIGAGVLCGVRTFHLADDEKAIKLNLVRVGTRISRNAQLGSLIALLFAVLLAAMPASAAEQFTPIKRPPTYPVILQEIKLITDTTSESRFELTFDPTATTFTPALGRPDQPGIGFLARRGSGAVQPSGMKGLVRSLSFDQEGDLLIVRFNATAAAGFSAVQTSQRTLEVTISSGAVATKKSQETAYGRLPGGLPPAAEPPPGEEGYELVLLKYADVSEVVGLLTDGVTVKSNDVFVPREPGFGSNSLTDNRQRQIREGQAHLNPGWSSKAV